MSFSSHPRLITIFLALALVLAACSQQGQQTLPQSLIPNSYDAATNIAQNLAQPATPLYQYTTLDYPGAVSTVATGINDLTQVVGYYVDGSGDNHAFILSNRRFKPIALSIAGVTVVQSQAWEINDSGWIVGNYIDSNGDRHGFVLKHGTVTTIDVAGSDPVRSFGAFGINKAGTIVGQFCSTYCLAVGTEEGYLLSGSTFTTLSYPGSDGASGAAYSINDHNQVVGYWEDTSGGEHGYKLSKGTYTSIDAPSACCTFSIGNNDRNQIVGWYVDSTGTTAHGYLLVGSKFTTLDVPGVESAGGNREQFYNVNLAGDIVGYYVDTSGKMHGFAGLPNLLIRSY
jgi:probable HAF family extracellular repeat protein